MLLHWLICILFEHKSLPLFAQKKYVWCNLVRNLKFNLLTLDDIMIFTTLCLAKNYILSLTHNDLILTTNVLKRKYVHQCTLCFVVNSDNISQNWYKQEPQVITNGQPLFFKNIYFSSLSQVQATFALLAPYSAIIRTFKGDILPSVCMIPSPNCFMEEKDCYHVLCLLC